MCNVYFASPRPQSTGLAARVSEEIGRLKSPLVRRSDPGVVVIKAGDDLQACAMRWGFARSFSVAINNARADKLESPMWKEAFDHRRCLVPVSIFYEWQALPHRGKQAYEIRRPDGEWMWIAGLYEPSMSYGRCYATITTEPPDWMQPIHDRMLAVLDEPQALAFLAGAPVPFAPYAGTLAAAPCVSPLKSQ